MNAVHYIESILALSTQPRDWKWTPAHSAIALAAWSEASSAIAVRPHVQFTQDRMQALLNCSPRHVAGLVASLKGVVFDVVGAGGQTRTYVLLRPPEHEAANAAVLKAEGIAAERAASRRAAKPTRHKSKSKGEQARDYRLLAERFRDRRLIAQQLQAAFSSRELLYTGPEVHACLEWLTSDETDPDVECFDTLITLAVADTDKPDHPERICMSTHREWRQRLIAQTET